MLHVSTGSARRSESLANISLSLGRRQTRAIQSKRRDSRHLISCTEPDSGGQHWPWLRRRPAGWTTPRTLRPLAPAGSARARWADAAAPRPQPPRGTRSERCAVPAGSAPARSKTGLDWAPRVCAKIRYGCCLAQRSDTKISSAPKPMWGFRRTSMQKQ